MYNNPFFNNQPSVNRIDAQIQELEKMKTQMQQINPMQPSINQTFQLTPNNQNTINYVNSIDDVNKEFVTNDTPFFSKDMSVLWIKNIKGEIKSYELTEIIIKDEKDMLIDSLKMQIDQLKKERLDNEPNDEYVVKSTKNEKSSNGKSNNKYDK